jgi:hypothetical protein
MFAGCKYKLHQSGSPYIPLQNINIANTLTDINDNIPFLWLESGMPRLSTTAEISTSGSLNFY